MILGIKIVPIVAKSVKTKRFLICECDLCHKIRDVRYQKSTKNKKHTYCSSKCSAIARNTIFSCEIDFKNAHIKRHETCKKLGNYGKSKREDAFYTKLCNVFNDVERYVLVNGWLIDFYIKSIDTYVQFDGVHWHGLNRPVEIIKQFKTKTDQNIYATILLRDQKQNEWFQTQNLKLVRTTDLDQFENALIKLTGCSYV